MPLHLSWPQHMTEATWCQCLWEQFTPTHMHTCIFTNRVCAKSGQEKMEAPQWPGEWLGEWSWKFHQCCSKKWQDYVLGLKSNLGRSRTSSCHVPSPGWDTHDAETLCPDQAWTVVSPVWNGNFCQGKLCRVSLKIMCLQLYGAFSGFSFPNFSHKCKCRVLDTRTRPKKDLQHLPMFLFLPQERSRYSAHPSVRVPLSQAQRHAPSS